jgi:hypothetical protein
MSKKKKEEHRRWFVVMNSELEYFCGLAYGGQLVWCGDFEEAKPLDKESKFIALQSMCYGKELILDYI